MLMPNTFNNRPWTNTKLRMNVCYQSFGYVSHVNKTTGVLKITELHRFT